MTTDRLTAIMAERVMGWTVGPDRFLVAGRRWLPRWRFQPVKKVADAFRLLESASPPAFSMNENDSGVSVRIQIDKKTGEAYGSSKAEAITVAIARAVGVPVDSID